MAEEYALLTEEQYLQLQQQLRHRQQRWQQYEQWTKYQDQTNVQYAGPIHPLDLWRDAGIAVPHEQAKHYMGRADSHPAVTMAMPLPPATKLHDTGESVEPARPDVRPLERSVVSTDPRLPVLAVDTEKIELERRAHHKNVEQNRRRQINEAIGEFKQMVPECRGRKLNKTYVLQEAVGFLSQLQEEIDRLTAANHELAGSNADLVKLLGPPFRGDNQQG